MENKLLNIFLGKIVIILFPIVIAFPFVRLLSTKAIMEWEYKKKNFPEDIFGFTTQQRIKYGKIFLDYWYKNLDISYLSQLTFEGTNTKMLNEREINHMIDVKKVVKFIYKIFYLATFIFFISLAYLFIRNKLMVARNLFYGSIFTLSMIIFLGIFGLFFFDIAFDFMHRFLAFEQGTYTFYENDTLIRLFPTKFWFDMFILMGTGIITSTLVILVTSWIYINR